MTHHPRPPLFGADINDGLGQPRVPTNAENVDRITRGLGGLLNRSAREFDRQWNEARAKDLVYAAEHGCMFYERRWAFTFAPPARVVSIVGLGVSE